jgi:hypothetical protein
MNKIAPFLTLFATLAFLVAPFVTDPFTGFAPERFPVPQISPPVQPAGYAFAIWGVIYIWLGVLAVTGATLRRADTGWQAVHLPLTLSLGPGALWLWLAGVSALGATVLIFWMLAFALWALLRAPSQDRWLLQAPVALYAGWLTAAAHVSLGVSLGGFGLVSAQTAALLALTSATVLAGAMLWHKPQAPEYGLAVIWAFIGVLVANLGGAAIVLAATGVAIAAITALVLRGLWAGQKRAGL